ncbi:MAG: hypothetical protein U0841_26540 [Chloroflexia bacterium]
MPAMDRSYVKSQEAREIDARARARRLRVRVTVVDEGQSYICGSRSRRGVTYTMQRTPVGWACSCQGYLHTGACKHRAGRAPQRARGWEFGMVAPLHRVGRYLPLVLPARGVRRRAASANQGASVVPFRPAVQPQAQLPIPYQ